MNRFKRGNPKVAIIGCGRMGEAILAGLISKEVFPIEDIVVTQPDLERGAYLEETYGVTCVQNNSDAFGAQIVILAVKPQIIDDVVKEIAPYVQKEHTCGDIRPLVISIAVGVSCERLEKNLFEGCAVVRVMPNTPALVGSGMSVISKGSFAEGGDLVDVSHIFDAIGDTIVLEEKFQDCAAALSGSGPAYFEMIVDALARAGVRNGLPRTISQQLVVKTMRGTADLIEKTGEHPQTLIDQVASPGGSTIQALSVMEQRGLYSALSAGVLAAIKRAEELGEDS